MLGPIFGEKQPTLPMNIKYVLRKVWPDTHSNDELLYI